MYREWITQLHTYVPAFRILAKGYLANTLMKPDTLQEILTEVKIHCLLPTQIIP